LSSIAQTPNSRGDSLPTADRTSAPTLPRGQLATFPSVLTTNPYQRLLYEQLTRYGFTLAEDPSFEVGWLVRARKDAGYVHFHWPQSHWRHDDCRNRRASALSWVELGLFGVRLAAARGLRYRVAWTIHQVYPHEVKSPRLDRMGAKLLARGSNVLIAHDLGTRETAREVLGRAARRIEIVPHGSYIGVYPPGRSRAAVRKELGIPADAFVFLCFGDLRLYKEVDRLIEAFTRADLANAALIVAGTVCAPEQGEAVRAVAKRDRRVKPVLSFIGGERVAELFEAADAAVIARGDGGTSGSLILSLSLGVPAVAARRTVYEELLDGEASGWLFAPGDADSLRQALERAAAATEDERRRKGAVALRRAEQLDWSKIGERTAGLLIGGNR
jgi:glycosyltransferase involved in cell wall biosynthesis